MQLEIVEVGNNEEPEHICINPSLYWGCCIIHYWDWASGACGSTCWNS